MERLAVVLAVASILLQLTSAEEAFLRNQLPLKVLVATPSELASDDEATAAAPQAAVTLTGRQAITVSVSTPLPPGCASLAQGCCVCFTMRGVQVSCLQLPQQHSVLCLGSARTPVVPESSACGASKAAQRHAQGRASQWCSQERLLAPLRDADCAAVPVRLIAGGVF